LGEAEINNCKIEILSEFVRLIRRCKINL